MIYRIVVSLITNLTIGSVRRLLRESHRRQRAVASTPGNVADQNISHIKIAAMWRRRHNLRRAGFTSCLTFERRLFQIRKNRNGIERRTGEDAIETGCPSEACCSSWSERLKIVRGLYSSIRRRDTLLDRGRCKRGRVTACRVGSGKGEGFN